MACRGMLLRPEQRNGRRTRRARLLGQAVTWTINAINNPVSVPRFTQVTDIISCHAFSVNNGGIGQSSAAAGALSHVRSA